MDFKYVISKFIHIYVCIYMYIYTHTSLYGRYNKTLFEFPV